MELMVDNPKWQQLQQRRASAITALDVILGLRDLRAKALRLKRRSKKQTVHVPPASKESALLNSRQRALDTLRSQASKAAIPAGKRKSSRALGFASLNLSHICVEALDEESQQYMGPMQTIKARNTAIVIRPVGEVNGMDVDQAAAAGAEQAAASAQQVASQGAVQAGVEAAADGAEAEDDAAGIKPFGMMDALVGDMDEDTMWEEI